MPHEPPALRWLGQIIDYTVAAAGAFMIGLVFYNVLSRYLLKTDVSWSSELCTLILIWTSFVGGAMAVRRQAHLGVTEFVMGLSRPMRARADTLQLLLTAVALGVLLWFGIDLTVQSWDNIAIAIKISNGWWYLAMPVGCALMLVFVLHQLALVLTRGCPLHELGPDVPGDDRPVAVASGAKP
jgi:TRAP-type C4-dicarboxylate transport system permease small subunit